MQRAIRLTKGTIGTMDLQSLEQSEMKSGGHRRWWLYEARGQFVAKELDKRAARRITAPIRTPQTFEWQKSALERKKQDLEWKLTKARAKLAQSRVGLRSLFSSERRREELEREVATLESDLSTVEDTLSTVETKLRKALQRKRTAEKRWHCISFHPEDSRLADKDRWGYSGVYMHVYMKPSVFEKAQAFQREEPIYLCTWFPQKQDKLEGKFWWHRDKFWASTGYSEEEARLLIWEKGRREQRKFERLGKAKAAAEEALEQGGRERIPEEVRLLVWERDGGRCVKCGSTEDLEFDHIIPISKGGSNTEKNVQLLCATCNREKRDHIA